MTVKIYVSRDSQEQPWPPDFVHENQAVIEILKRWWVFHPAEALYVAIANLHYPSADLVVLTRHGIGIMELKHYYGHIERRGSTWYAGPTPIKSGAEDQGRRNPHEQVQNYAAKIREKLLNSQQIPEWLPGRRSEKEAFKFQTAVCFTHPDADFKSFKTDLRQHPLPTQAWESFAVLGLKDTPEWVASLRFEADQGRERRFEPHTLTDEAMVRIATRLFHGTEWTEVYPLMPTGEPYGYLTLLENGQRIQVFGLDQDDMVIGRDPLCGVPIPERFARVSQKHARIWRELGKVYIADSDSTNGTYVNRLKIRGKRELKPSVQITLGGNTPGEKVCLLTFSMTPPVKPKATEVE